MKSFLEKVWILFTWCIFIEWIIKDLIIFKENPEFIKEINWWIISQQLAEKRKEMFQVSFNQNIVNKFTEIYNLDLSFNKLFTTILCIRDTFWHSRISVEEERIWYRPNTKQKFEKCKDVFWITWDWDTISIDNKTLDFEAKIKAIEAFDVEFFPEIAKSIWLDYQKIR